MELLFLNATIMCSNHDVTAKKKRLNLLKEMLKMRKMEQRELLLDPGMKRVFDLDPIW